MARGFDNKEVAKNAGAKGKRGKAILPSEAKKMLLEGAIERMPKMWEQIEEAKGATYVKLLTEILKLVLPKDVNIEGQINADESIARTKLLERLAQKVGSGDDKKGG